MYKLRQHTAFTGFRIVIQHHVEPKLDLVRHFIPNIDDMLQDVVKIGALEIHHLGYEATMSVPLEYHGKAAWRTVSTNVSSDLPLFEVVYDLEVGPEFIVVDNVVFS